MSMVRHLSLEALENPPPAAPFATIGDEKHAALQTLAEILDSSITTFVQLHQGRSDPVKHQRWQNGREERATAYHSHT